MTAKNAFYAQSGGVTAVINASAAGVIETARQHSDKIANFLSNKITLVSQTGFPSDSWSYWLMVVLEKIAGIALVSKLRAILLMEADFNFHSKIIFEKHNLDQA